MFIAVVDIKEIERKNSKNRIDLLDKIKVFIEKSKFGKSKKVEA